MFFFLPTSLFIIAKTPMSKNLAYNFPTFRFYFRNNIINLVDAGNIFSLEIFVNYADIYVPSEQQ